MTDQECLEIVAARWVQLEKAIGSVADLLYASENLRKSEVYNQICVASAKLALIGGDIWALRQEPDAAPPAPSPAVYPPDALLVWHGTCEECRKSLPIDDMVDELCPACAAANG